MIRLLEFLWHGCWHTWQLNNIRQVEYTDAPIRYAEAIYKCSKCNRFKSQKV